MKTNLFPAALAAVLLLPACLPVDTYYRAGVTADRLDRDRAACSAQALRAAPVNNQTRTNPGYFVPGRVVCSGTGVCTTTPGYWVPPTSYVVDVNASLRKQSEQACMASRGYSPVELPACPKRIADAAPDIGNAVLPEPGDKTCAIRRADGSVQVVVRQ